MYNTVVWVIEQGLRLILLIYMLPRYQIFGIYYSYIPGIIAKDIVSILIIRKKIVKFKPYWMHTTIVPLLSALSIYGILYVIQTAIQASPLWLRASILVIGLVFGLFIYG